LSAALGHPHALVGELTRTPELGRRREGLRGPEMAAGELGILLRW